MSKSEQRQKIELVQVRLSGAELKRLDDMRRAEDDLPSRAEMIRRLIARSKV